MRSICTDFIKTLFTMKNVTSVTLPTTLQNFSWLVLLIVYGATSFLLLLCRCESFIIKKIEKKIVTVSIVMCKATTPMIQLICQNWNSKKKPEYDQHSVPETVFHNHIDFYTEVTHSITTSIDKPFTMLTLEDKLLEVYAVVCVVREIWKKDNFFTDLLVVFEQLI